MPEALDPTRWDNILSRPAWYNELWPELKAWRQKIEGLKASNPHEARRLKDLVQEYFEDKLASRSIALGKSGDDFDEKRQPISQIIIHHTGRQPGITLGRLNAIHLLNLYVPEFASHGSNHPIWSNHMRKGVPVCWAYHWLVRENGKAERLLHDNEIGWQAGNWEVNCQSVAICIDDDLASNAPSGLVLNAIRELISSRYSTVKSGHILGHKEVNPKTICPGPNFDAWKTHLLSDGGS